MGQGASKAGSKSTKLRYGLARPPIAATAKGQTEGAVDGAMRPEEALTKEPIKLDSPVEGQQTADPALAGFLDCLGGSIKGRRINVLPPEDQAWRRVKASNEGRLDSNLLRCLFEDALSAKFQEEGRPSARLLAQEYGVDEALLKIVLNYNAAPVLKESEGGQLIGSWPSYHPASREAR